MLSILFEVMRGDASPMLLVAYAASVCYIIFCSVPLHEYAHARVAVALGDDTPVLRGRLTLNPMAHVSPIGALLMIFCGFGFAKPVEVRMRNFKNPKRDMAFVALAGPVCNILQAVVCLIFYCAVYKFLPRTNVFVYAFLYFFSYAATININLAVFNFIPVPPLDGSKLLSALLPSKYYFKLIQHERQISLILIILLFTGILTVPLEFISNALMSLLIKLIGLPFGLS